ncbi:MAG: hypothetical protein HFG05_12460 [Oscillibacter sp.]|nr:hypothetical protein [Oscillibacter sp.]
MTTGQLLFYSGLVLLGLTVITAILFLLKKPKYIPENVIYEEMKTGHTQRLQNSYPMERVAICREPSVEPVETELLAEETASIFQSEETEILPPTEKT